MPRLVLLGGSMRERSVSRAALRAAAVIAQEKGFETEILDVRELNLPMYTPDANDPDYFEEPHRTNLHRLLEGCRRADAMVWSSPTYHGTVSGVFKNALDFIEMLSEEQRPYLHQIPVGLIAINDSVTFSAMINCVYELRGWSAPTKVLLRRDLFDPDLQALRDERAQRRLSRMVDNLAYFVQTVRS
jgi:FMN reductase